MVVKIVTDFGVLMRLAAKEGKLKNSPDQEAYKKAKAERKAYADICLKSDEMRI